MSHKVKPAAVTRIYDRVLQVGAWVAKVKLSSMILYHQCESYTYHHDLRHRRDRRKSIRGEFFYVTRLVIMR